jgi:hypothetical protein
LLKQQHSNKNKKEILLRIQFFMPTVVAMQAQFGSPCFQLTATKWTEAPFLLARLIIPMREPCLRLLHTTVIKRYQKHDVLCHGRFIQLHYRWKPDTATWHCFSATIADLVSHQRTLHFFGNYS